MGLIQFFREFAKKAREETPREYKVQPMTDEDDNGSRGWIGVDLDGTLARSDTLVSLSKIGKPIPRMAERVKQMIKQGYRIKIFTARASDPDQIPLIQRWLAEHEFPELEITNAKDYDMIRCYDDRAVQVIANTGVLVSDQTGD